MNSHRVTGRYVTVYHPTDRPPGNHTDDTLSEAFERCDRLNNDWRSGGRWAVHEIGPEVTRDD